LLRPPFDQEEVYLGRMVVRAWGLALAVAACSFRPAVAPVDANGSNSLLLRRQITVDNSKIVEPLNDFPVLVSLTQADNEDALGPTSTSVRFVAADDETVLPYDVDTASGSGALFWVSVSIPEMSQAQPTFWVYFGALGSAETPDAPAVWASFISVHHLGDANFLDSTSNGHDGMAGSAASPPASTTGVVGAASKFDGSGNAVLLAATTNVYDLTTALSVTAWVQLQQWESEWECIVCKGDSAWRLHRGDLSSFPDFGTRQASDGAYLDLEATTAIDDDRWHMLAMEYDGSDKLIYVDGGGPTAMSSSAFATNAYQVSLGCNQEPTSPPGPRHFQGVMDEVRIAATPRGSAWIAAEYQTVTSPSFVTLGDIEQVP
jgi:biopolymer transport protein ExbB